MASAEFPKGKYVRTGIYDGDHLRRLAVTGATHPVIVFLWKVVSCDADGAVKMWDARMVAEIGTMEAGQHPLNSVCLDRSATRLAAASNDGTVKVRAVEVEDYYTAGAGE